MNKLFVGLELAIALKGLRFDEECLCFYKDDKLSVTDQHWGSSISGISKGLGYRIDDLILAPTYQQVTDWLRDEHGIIIVVMPFLMEDNSITYEYTNYTNKDQDEIDHGDGPYEDYYDALEASIKSALLCI